MAGPRSEKPTTVHSIRAKAGLWAAAKERAERENVQMNTVVNELLEGYAKGHLDLPKVIRVYGQQTSIANDDA